MNRRFLITGLPRSRTAWFAVATGALHEPFSQSGDFDTWPLSPGVSDSGVAPRLPTILRDFEPRTLVIERPMADVITSMNAYLANVPGLDWKKMYAYLGASLCGLRVDHPLVLRASYDSLNSVEMVRACLAWLKVKEPANLEQMIHFNVQSNLGWNLALLRQRAAG